VLINFFSNVVKQILLTIWTLFMPEEPEGTISRFEYDLFDVVSGGEQWEELQRLGHDLTTDSVMPPLR
jgi:hypothetical protein